MSEIVAVVSDFGGVLTTPLETAFLEFQQEHGIPLDALGRAIGAAAATNGAHPLFELEKGRISELQFTEQLSSALSDELGRTVDLGSFAAGFGTGLKPNPGMIEKMRALRDRGLRMALCTNNVREWEARWRAMLPVDEIFELVVDSAYVGMRKPEPGIYALTLERLGLPGEQCLFVDDFEINCSAAAEHGMTTVWFRDNDQAIEEIDAALA
jgi:epoxide hydrolase-like predicted phosphatase